MCVRFVRGDGTGREGVVKSLAWRPLREERLAEGARVEAQRDRVEAHAAQLAACARGRAVGGVRAASCYMLPSACCMPQASRVMLHASSVKRHASSALPTRSREPFRQSASESVTCTREYSYDRRVSRTTVGGVRAAKLWLTPGAGGDVGVKEAAGSVSPTTTSARCR